LIITFLANQPVSGLSSFDALLRPQPHERPAEDLTMESLQ
jgi:hypothetical protein